ncbi:MAG: nucleotidyltransferase family protein [Cyanobacteria bacterium J06632_3]
MSEALFLELMEKAERLTRAEQKRLVRYVDWLTNCPKAKNRVSHRLEDILPYQADIVRIVEKHGATNARLYGSIVRGESRPDSDVDIVVDLSDRPQSMLFPVRLIRELEELLGRRVDVVTFSGLRDSAKADVLKEAISLCAQTSNASAIS